jgi:arginine/lysine/ornithine decarboxylase
MMPPLAAAMMRFNQDHAYSWHTPGHAGGTAFLKSPVGRVFFDYYGENLLRSDLSISVGSLGSLLDHSGPMGEHERYAARVFGADRTYSVTNGTSMSNRVIFMAAVGRDQIALCDRNCHKSIEHSLVMSGGIPNYLVPLRNRYGIIGPIPPARLAKEGHQGLDQGKLAGHQGHRKAGGLRSRHELDVRRTLLQREARAGAARSERRSHPFRRSVVCVRALQSAVSRSARDAWRSEGSQGSDDFRHAFHAQAAGRALAGVLPAHS